MKDPNAMKFRTLRLDSQSLQNKLVPVDGAVDLLLALGFTKETVKAPRQPDFQAVQQTPGQCKKCTYINPISATNCKLCLETLPVWVCLSWPVSMQWRGKTYVCLARPMLSLRQPAGPAVSTSEVLVLRDEAIPTATACGGPFHTVSSKAEVPNIYLCSQINNIA